MSIGIRAEDILNDDANEIVLESGIKARKGTVYATILNIRKIDELASQGKDYEKIKEAIVETIPILKSLRLFELFSLEEWLSKPEEIGRFTVGLLYLQIYPEERNARVQYLLKKSNIKNFLN